jgi:hypothetical protein
MADDLTGPVTPEDMLREINRTIRDRDWKYPKMIKKGTLAINEARRRNRAIHAIRELIEAHLARQKDLFGGR